MSAHRYLYGIDVTKEEDINLQLMEWIHEALEKKS